LKDFPDHPAYRQPRPSQIPTNALRKGAWDDPAPVIPTIWAIVWTAPRGEQKAVDELMRYGYAAFLPMVTVWRDVPQRQRKRVGARREPVERPALSRYVFVGLNPQIQSWGLIADAEGVSEVIRADGPQQPRLQADIARMRKAYEKGDLDEVRRENEAMRERLQAIVGKRVYVTDGPLTGMQGEAESLHGKREVEVSIGPVRVIMDINTLTEVD
jgi:transcription antitermination factor NusG